MCSGAGLNGLGMRNNVTRMATMKHAQQGAPVFTWYFTWQSPMLEDAGAWHTAELAFCFDNTARCAQGTGNGPEAQALARRMATAWANFARTGESQPTWSAVDAVHTRWVPDDGLRRGVSHRHRSGSRGPEDSGDVNSTMNRRQFLESVAGVGAAASVGRSVFARGLHDDGGGGFAPARRHVIRRMGTAADVLEDVLRGQQRCRGRRQRSWHPGAALPHHQQGRPGAAARRARGDRRGHLS